MKATTLALVGATGGAGTTRTAVELAAIGARDGSEVAVVDAAFTTQGLSEYVSGRIDPDLTTLLTDEPETSLSTAAYPIAGSEAARSEGVGKTAGDASGEGEFGRVDAVPARHLTPCDGGQRRRSRAVRHIRDTVHGTIRARRDVHTPGRRTIDDRSSRPHSRFEVC